jgi:hypothetical protein
MTSINKESLEKLNLNFNNGDPMVESRRLSCFNKIGLYSSLDLLVLYYVGSSGHNASNRL